MLMSISILQLEMDYSYLNSGGGPAACNFDSMSAAAAAAAAADSFVYGDMGNPYRCYGPRDARSLSEVLSSFSKFQN